MIDKVGKEKAIWRLYICVSFSGHMKYNNRSVISTSICFKRVKVGKKTKQVPVIRYKNDADN